MWAISAVVVDLPLVPVIPMKRAASAARAISSMSLMMGQRLAEASAATGCGLGKLWGMPGESTSAAGFDQSDAARSTTGRPAALASSRALGLSSQAHTWAPLALSARAAGRPDL